ncbi:MAG TPA: SDR family oxidoreductase [Cytophagales bacterium]|nr:SDR family oxidoreductase [Cytophagales bacterium]
MKKVLITGSNGLLGQKLVELLIRKKEFEIIATARGENRLPSALTGYTYYRLDITNEGQVLSLVEETKPHYIINTAAMTNVDQCETDRNECWKLNVEAVKYLIEAAKSTKSLLLHLSTDFIFDGTAGPYEEEAEANPLSYYGQSKLAAEQLIINSDIKWAIARTVLVYGIAHDMSRTNIILWVKKSLEEGKTINVVDDQWRTPTLAEDLAMGCYLIIKNEAEGIFNISGKDLLTPYQMALKTADFFKLDTSLINKTDSTKFTQPAKRPPRTGFVIEKAIRMLDYNPVSFEEGIDFVAKQVK